MCKAFWFELDEFLEDHLLASGETDTFYEKLSNGEYLLDEIDKMGEARDDIEGFSISHFKCPDNINTAVSCVWYDAGGFNMFNFMFFIRNGSEEE